MLNKAWDCKWCGEKIQREFMMDCDGCGQGMSCWSLCLATLSTSITRALNNSVLNLLESVANSNTSNFESISGEDTLSKQEEGNDKLKDVMDKWLRRRREKICKMCKVCNLKEIIEACTTCDKKSGQTLSPSGVCKTSVSVKPVKPGGRIVRQES